MRRARSRKRPSPKTPMRWRRRGGSSATPAPARCWSRAAISRANLSTFFSRPERGASFAGRRIPTRNTHGTGCALSSAIACELAKGAPLIDAIAAAKALARRRAGGGGPAAIERGPRPAASFLCAVALRAPSPALPRFAGEGEDCAVINAGEFLQPREFLLQGVNRAAPFSRFSGGRWREAPEGGRN